MTSYNKYKSFHFSKLLKKTKVLVCKNKIFILHEKILLTYNYYKTLSITYSSFYSPSSFTFNPLNMTLSSSSSSICYKSVQTKPVNHCHYEKLSVVITPNNRQRRQLIINNNNNNSSSANIITTTSNTTNKSKLFNLLHVECIIHIEYPQYPQYTQSIDIFSLEKLDTLLNDQGILTIQICYNN